MTSGITGRQSFSIANLRRNSLEETKLPPLPATPKLQAEQALAEKLNNSQDYTQPVSQGQSKPQVVHKKTRARRDTSASIQLKDPGAYAALSAKSYKSLEKVAIEFSKKPEKWQDMKEKGLTQEEAVFASVFAKKKPVFAEHADAKAKTYFEDMHAAIEFKMNGTLRLPSPERKAALKAEFAQCKTYEILDKKIAEAEAAFKADPTEKNEMRLNDLRSERGMFEGAAGEILARKTMYTTMITYGLTLEEAAFISAYTAEHFARVNPEMRNAAFHHRGKISEKTQEFIRVFNAGIEKLPPYKRPEGQENVVYRISGLTGMSLKGNAEGRTYTFPTITSLSLNENPGKFYGENRYKITLGENTKARDIRVFSQADKQEAEVVFPPGAKIRISGWGEAENIENIQSISAAKQNIADAAGGPQTPFQSAKVQTTYVQAKRRIIFAEEVEE